MDSKPSFRFQCLARIALVAKYSFIHATKRHLAVRALGGRRLMFPVILLLNLSFLFFPARRKQFLSYIYHHLLLLVLLIFPSSHDHNCTEPVLLLPPMSASTIAVLLLLNYPMPQLLLQLLGLLLLLLVPFLLLQLLTEMHKLQVWWFESHFLLATCQSILEQFT